jgi:integrase
LLTASRQGVAFDVATGLPETMLPAERETRTWYELACRFVEREWMRASSKQRTSIADALATVTPVLVVSAGAGRRPAAKVLRAALYGWAFNMHRRAMEPPPEVADALAWVERYSLPLPQLLKEDVLDRLVAALGSTMAGGPAAATTYRRKRPVIGSALKYAVRKGWLDANPLDRADLRGPKVTEAVDPRRVPSPAQGRDLIAAVERVAPSGGRLRAFFGCMYYSAMRPGEAAVVRWDDFDLPPRDQADEYGVVYLARSAPRVGRVWTDGGTTRDERGLKHRPSNAVRKAPVPPPLVRQLWDHYDRYGLAPDGRLFRAVRTDGPISESVYGRVWQRARELALTTAQYDAGLAKRPYDLRHACVSGWFTAGVDPARIAEWAGHGVAVLLRVYVHCLDGGHGDALQRITNMLAAGTTHGGDVLPGDRVGRVGRAAGQVRLGPN